MPGANRIAPYNREMRSRLNLALVVIAGALALVLTVVRQSPEGVVSFDFETQAVRAAPGDAQGGKPDLSTLKIFNAALFKVNDRYVDPTRIDPKKMLYAALDSVQFNIPEVLVESDQAHNKVSVAVNDKKQTFDTAKVDSPWRLQLMLQSIFKFVETNMNAGADLAKIEYAATNGMLSTLDPHSILMDPEQARDMDVSTSGKFGGLGIVIRMIDRKLTVVKPMKDTPAWRKGIKAGDHIVKINNDPTENLTSNEAVDRMRGDPHTPVTLYIDRKGESALLKVDLVRDVIHVSQVEHKLLDHGVGYLRVKQFSKGIADDVADAMREMSGQGATAWVLDLRYNPGGLLEEAVKLSDLFVDKGILVTTVSGKDRDERAAGKGFGDTGASLAVLVNGQSASASEIVAGALKNLDRAAIIGSRTFGKGSVQELYDFGDHSKLKLTIAQYLTPGDRSIQNLGIVPDIALHRMYVPDKNDKTDAKLLDAGYVRLLTPTHTYGEKDLDAHLVSTYAKDGDKPAYELSYLIEKKPAAVGADPKAPVITPADDEDPPDEDEIVEDFEMRFAKQLVSSVRESNRLKLVADASALVKKVRADEETKEVAALSQIGVDWTAPATQTDNANLDISVATSPSGVLKAGDVVSVTATVKNTGTGAAYRVLPRIQADDNMFEDTELPIGKVGPGETKTYTAKVSLPKDALDRVDRLGLEVKDARNSPTHVTPAAIHVEAAARPVFSYAYQLVDDGNGDGLVQRGEKYRLQVQVKNTGAGASEETTVLLRNASGDGVVLDKSRFELKPADAPATAVSLAPGQVKELEFPFSTQSSLHGDELVLELMIYDQVLDVRSSEKLHFAITPAVIGVPAHGNVVAKSATQIHAGAAPDSSVIGMTGKGAGFPVIAQYGAFTKVKLAGNKVGFLPTDSVSQGGNDSGTYTAQWNSTPPTIALNVKSLETTGETYRLAGTVSDDTHVEDVYVFVSNQTSKIESRKVFYRSNRSGKDGKVLDFTADLPLWPGSNVVTVVARENAEVGSMKTMFVYRGSPRTALTP